MTKSPISTISYNTEPFLKEVLQKWYDAHLIQAYMYIKHKGEDGDKDHIHLRIIPNKSLDPMNLSSDLVEYEKGKDKPLGVRPWQPSKESDWVLYAVHDSDYLRMKYGGGDKGEKIPYKWEDICVSQLFDMEITYIRARQTLKHCSANIAKQIQDGVSPLNMMYEGENIHTINAVVRALNQTDYERLNRIYLHLKIKYDLLSDELLKNGLYVEWVKKEFDDGKKCEVPLIKKVDAGNIDSKKIVNI